MSGYVSQYGRNALLVGFIMFGLAAVYCLWAGSRAFAFDIPGIVAGTVATAVGSVLLALALGCVLTRRLTAPRDAHNALSAIPRAVRKPRVFSPPAIALASALGAAPAGLLLLALNFLHLGEKPMARLSLFGVVVGVVVVGIMPFHVGVWFTLALWPVQVILLAVLAHRVQRRLAVGHQSAGGDWASDWSAAGIGCLVAGLEIAVLLTRNTVVGLLKLKA